jgi:CheY-like chemotaxis protein
MLILFLDDQNDRHTLAEKYLTTAGHKVLHTYTPDEAIEVLLSSKNRIGLALLDHDLGIIVKDDESIFGKKEISGLDFVKSMIKLPKDKLPARVVVHSYNNDGAKNMLNLLTPLGIHSIHTPFSGEMLSALVKELVAQ